MRDVLIRPVITEKGAKLTERENKYGFIVERSANKIEIKKAVEKLFGVSVTNVSTMVTPGKSRTRFTKGGWIKGKTSALKKAIVSLQEGDTIDFYSKI